MLPMHRMSLESHQSLSQTLNDSENNETVIETHHRTRLISFNETSFTKRIDGALALEQIKRRLSLGNAVRKPYVVVDEEELERQNSFNANLRKNASSYRKAVQWLQYMYEKTRMQKIAPLLLLVAYTFLGGVVIYYIEAPVEARSIEAKQEFLNVKKDQLVMELWNAKNKNLSKAEAMMKLTESVYWYTITVLYIDGNLTKIPPPNSVINKTVENLRFYTTQMAQRCWEIRLEIKSVHQAERLIEKSLAHFEQLTGIATTVKPVWTLSNALFLAITIYTTIGYGSVFPHTTAGRVATILYAICGIPLYLMILHKLGRVFLALLHKFYNFCLWIGYHFRCITELHKYHQTSKISFQTGSSNESYNVPVSLAIGVTFGWMFACAGVFCVFFETSWDYFTSFYFFFISLTTIGFGDVTPTHPEDMFTFFGLIIIGLSLVSMCINVVQLKLELLFEDMMMALIEETGELESPADFKAPVGFVQLFHFLKKKRRTKNQSMLYLPLMAEKKRQALLEEFKRKSNFRTICTQTDLDVSSENSTQTESGGSSKSSSVTNSQTPSGQTVLSPNSVFTNSVYNFSSRKPSEIGGRLFHYRGSVDENNIMDVDKVHYYNRRWSEAATVRRAFIPNRYRYGRKTQSFYNPTELMHNQSRLSRTFIMYPQIHAGDPKLIRVSAGFHESWTFGLGQSKSQLPVMCLKRLSKEPARDDFKSLIHEIGARLNDCRTIVKYPTPTLKSTKTHQPNWGDTAL